MLRSLHVKNLALIKETEVTFGEGLNILTGETGAGKSLLIGSLSLALGGKFDAKLLRKGEETGLVELTFETKEPSVRQKLRELDIDESEDGSILLTRKLSTGKSTCRINGETVSAKQLSELSELLIDIHGQHEHQSLLHKRKHLEILDAYCGDAFAVALSTHEETYDRYKALQKELSEASLDDASRAREQSLAEFECKEILEAHLIPGEDVELEKSYRLMVNAQKITENLAECLHMSSGETQEGAANAIARAVRAMRAVADYDERLAGLEEELGQIENLLQDFNFDLAEYLSETEFDEGQFREVEERLNLVNHLKSKYGDSIEKILSYAEERQAYLDKLSDYDMYIADLQERVKNSGEEVHASCRQLSKLRTQSAAVLAKKLCDALVALNFLQVQFEVAVRPEQTITRLGYDDVEFMLSTNPGEDLKPLGEVASGGELSRVMLAIKTVFADQDVIDTLIFDEIDAGISGRTAWKVSGQLHRVASKHQVICITHLPQIAAMADVHFLIAKSSTDESTITDLKCLDEEESLLELARLLGSDALSEAALTNAREMKNQANSVKLS